MYQQIKVYPNGLNKSFSSQFSERSNSKTLEGGRVQQPKYYDNQHDKDIGLSYYNILIFARRHSHISVFSEKREREELLLIIVLMFYRSQRMK